MKRTLTIFFIVIAGHCLAQADSTLKVAKKPDTPTHKAILQTADTIKPSSAAKATVSDTAAKTATVLQKPTKDSSLGKGVNAATVKPALRWDEDSVFARLLTFRHNNTGKPQALNEGEDRYPEGQEQLFYMVATLVLFAAAVKAAYPKYFRDIFRFFVQTSQRQKQTPEQIVQGYVPGFLFNILFFIVGGMVITLYGIKINYISGTLIPPVLYCAGILAVIYMLKYTVTSLAGLVFNVKEAAGMYSFIVFLVNRVIGILLLPLLVLLAFYNGDANTVLFTVAASLVFFLLIYRYAVSLTVIRKNLKVSALHFFIYLCAVELMPLLVIYKELFDQVHSK